MINTVLGSVPKDALGVTLMHEHIIFDMHGALENSSDRYNKKDVLDYIIPYLFELKGYGCQTLVDASTKGTSRDIDILKKCSELTGLNIVTNSGLWNSGETDCNTVPNEIMNNDINGVARIWTDEYIYGIDGTTSRPGYIKLAINGHPLSKFHEKILRAAMRTSKSTGLTIQCHICQLPLIDQVLLVMKEENLDPSKFIWVHADFNQNIDKIIEVTKEGVWVELDYLARIEKFNWHIQAIETLSTSGLLDRVLLSQDAGSYRVGKNNDKSTFLPYTRIFKEFIPLCTSNGISSDIFKKLLITNPACALSISKQVH